MAPGAPTIQVLLDNFLGTFPYDITAYVDVTAGIAWSRGRPDEESDNNAGELSLTVDNTDGRFTVGGGGPYGAAQNQQIRLKLNGTTVWTGRVQSWPVDFPGKGLGYATVKLTAVDDTARLSRKTLRSSIEEEILVDGPTAYYTMGEAVGATQAGDSSGKGMPSLVAAGTGAAVVFGNGTGPVDGLTAAQMSGGQVLTAAAGSNYLASAWSLEIWFNIAAPPASPMALGMAQDQLSAITQMTINTSGQVIGVGVTGPNVCDGHTHQAVITYDGGTFSALYVDGVFIGSSGASPSNMNVLYVGYGFLTTLNLAGTVSHVATYALALQVSRVLSHYNAGHSDFLSETPSARLTRIASYAGTPVGTLDTAGATLMGPANQQGKKATDVLDEVGSATLGTVYVDANGALSSVNGYSIVGDTTADASLSGIWVDDSISAENDMAQVVNIASGQATNSENVFTVGNAFSRTVHGDYPESFEWNVSTDAQALDRTNWLVNIYGGPSPRVPTLKLDLLTMDSTALAGAMALDLAKFLHLTNMPSQYPSASDLIVQGFQGQLTLGTESDEWSLTLNCSLHILFAAWLLGDSFWGVLGGTTKLYAA